MAERRLLEVFGPPAVSMIPGGDVITRNTFSQEAGVSQLDVCVVGEINLDVILYGLPQNLVLDRELLATGLSITLGSSSAIFAHNLAMLGNHVGFVSKVGPDPFGKIALERLASAGVDVQHVNRSTGQTSTGLTVVLPYSQGRYILTFPGTMFEMQYSDIDSEYLRSARHLHLSSFFLHRALRPKIGDLFREAKAAGLSTSLDTNDDPENEWDAGLLEVLKHVDIFLPNDREARKAAKTENLAQAVQVLAGLAKIVVVKRGTAAAICQSGQEQLSLVPPKVSCVDDVGAGDSFDAGFIHRYLAGGSLAECLAFANLAGAYSTTKEGGTEAFRDREGFAAFTRRYSTTTSIGAFPSRL